MFTSEPFHLRKPWRLPDSFLGAARMPQEFILIHYDIHLPPGEVPLFPLVTGKREGSRVAPEEGAALQGRN